MLRLLRPMPMTGRLEVSIIIIISGSGARASAPQPRPPAHCTGLSPTYSPPITNGFLNIKLKERTWNKTTRYSFNISGVCKQTSDQGITRLASEVGCCVSLPPMTTVLSGWAGAGAGEYRSPITMGSRASCAQWSAVPRVTCRVSRPPGGEPRS